MNARNMEELAQDVARRWDGHSPAYNLVRDYGRTYGFPLWFKDHDPDAQDEVSIRYNLERFKENIIELVDAVQELIWGEDCEQAAPSRIGVKHTAWA